jgi:hypothetical protein
MNLRSAPTIACLALVLAACSSAVGDADAGSDTRAAAFTMDRTLTSET